MQKNTTDPAEKKDQDEASAPIAGLILDLDNVALDGHALLYDALKNALKGKDLSLTLVQFSRLCLSRSIDAFMPDLLDDLGKKQLSATKLAGQVADDFLKALCGDGVKLPGGIKKLLGAARTKGFALGAVSTLNEKDAQALADQLGLTAMGVTLQVGEGPGDGLDIEDWECMAQALNLPTAACVAIVADAAASRLVLAAGMNGVVKPSATTTFQDFGGVDMIVDTLDAAAIDSILDIPGCD